MLRLCVSGSGAKGGMAGEFATAAAFTTALIAWAILSFRLQVLGQAMVLLACSLVAREERGRMECQGLEVWIVDARAPVADDNGSCALVTSYPTPTPTRVLTPGQSGSPSGSGEPTAGAHACTSSTNPHPTSV